MDLNQCQEFCAEMFPDKKIEYMFDEKCHKAICFIFTDGLPNTAHQIECHKVKVSVEGRDPFYVPITPHRSMAGFALMKQTIMDKNDFYLNPSEKEVLTKKKEESIEEFNKMITQMSESLGMPEELIKGKLENV